MEVEEQKHDKWTVRQNYDEGIRIPEFNEYLNEFASCEERNLFKNMRN